MKIIGTKEEIEDMKVALDRYCDNLECGDCKFNYGTDCERCGLDRLEYEVIGDENC